MHKWLFFLLLAFTPLFADVAFVYFGPQQHQWMDTSKYPVDGKGLNEWSLINYNLTKVGEKFFNTLLTDNELTRLQDPSTTVILVNNLPVRFRKDWKDFLAKIPAKKVLVCWEPAFAYPSLHSKETFDFFDLVVTWNPDLVDNKKFFLFNYPRLAPFRPEAPSFEKRHLLTQICGNHASKHRNQLYSLRRDAIHYFEHRPGADFRFYGRGWNSSFHTYGGSVTDKIPVLQKYRFSLCFENTHGEKGYITEKIFDCFCAQCIPIYYGAPDIAELIPKNCYIDWNDFKNFKKLYAYLEKMPKKEYLRYVENIQKFLSSKQACRFSQECFAQALYNAIIKAKSLQKKAQ